MASLGDYNFLSASANGYTNQLSGQFGVISNDFQHTSTLLSAPLKFPKPQRTVGRAVPSYSTTQSASYSTHAFNNNHNSNINNMNKSNFPTQSNIQRAARHRQPVPTHNYLSGSTIPSNSATMVRPRNTNFDYFDGNITHLGSSASTIPLNSVSINRRQAPSAYASTIAQRTPNYPESQVPLNQDPNPILIKKKPTAPINYTQNISVKFLQPPPPQQPGDIVITQQKDVQAPPVAPKIVRHRPPPPAKPAPMIVRERPPPAPAPIPPEHHVIPGKVIPPPPRKVITERLPQLPQPPQDIIVERWLEYAPRVRRVVFHPAPKLIPAPAPKNVIIQWDSPRVALNRQFRNLGVSAAHPHTYAAKHGASLVDSSAIPNIARQVRPENGLILAAESRPHPVRLIGDVSALKLINRNSHGAPGSQLSLAASLPNVPSVVSVPMPTSEHAVTLIAEETASFENINSNILGPIATGSDLALNNSNAFINNIHGSNVYDTGLVSNSAVALSDGLVSGSGLINASGSAYYDF